MWTICGMGLNTDAWEINATVKLNIHQINLSWRGYFQVPQGSARHVPLNAGEGD